MAVSFETGHEEMIHDAQVDFYGTRLATCSSDRTIKIFSIPMEDKGDPVLLRELKEHEGPVFEVAWGHPRHGSMLASCGHDGKVIVWKEESKNVWRPSFKYSHDSSANSLSWAKERCELVSASSDGTVCVSTKADAADTWSQIAFNAGQSGVNGVSWGPDRMLATAGCDGTVKIWVFHEDSNTFVESVTLKKHTDWVRDVAWAPGDAGMLASASQDMTVVVWKEKDGSWEGTSLPSFGAVVWRVSWSATGTVLAVSAADNSVTLWKEQPDGSFVKVSAVSE